jgi:hypothetical protein
MATGNPNSPCYRKARKMLDKLFNIKEWHDLRQGAAYLGSHWQQSNDLSTIEVNMDRYINGIESERPKRSDPNDRALTERETTAFRSLLMKLAWPVRHVLPELAYGVSYLSTVVTKATVEDAKKLHGLVEEAKSIIKAGGGRIKFHAIDLNKIIVLSGLDASYAKEGV